MKLIRSLHLKKMREKHRLYLLEGGTIISDLLRSGELNPENTRFLCGTEEWMRTHPEIPGKLKETYAVADQRQLEKLSSFLSGPEIMAVVTIPDNSFDPSLLKNDFTILLDSVRDPGNLGTIIRTADWFGFSTIICSTDCVDCYNEKVVQASMGAVLRVRTHYADLPAILDYAKREDVPVYGTTMDGSDFYESGLRIPSVIIFGNEASGIRPELSRYFTGKIRIPSFPSGMSKMESLNVASSVAVICADLRRRFR